MNITLPDTILRNDEIINIKKKDEVKKPKIISDTIPTFVQDIDGKWIRNPLFVKDTNGMWIKNPDLQVECNN
tara:strand:+ start:208 stop:423 length:216 start_codon:yes stop_codon:yes gene_type:complete